MNLIEENNTKNTPVAFSLFKKNQHIKWIAKGMFKNGGWYCTDDDKRTDGCYVVNLYDLPGDWTLAGYQSKVTVPITENTEDTPTKNITQKVQVWNHIETYMDTNDVWQFGRANLLKEGLDSYMVEWKTKTPEQTLTRILVGLVKEGKIKRVKEGIYKLT